MNKRAAGAFVIFMFMGMIVFITATLITFNTTNKKVIDEVNLIPVLKDFYNEQDKFLIYSTESSKLAASQAFYLVAKDSAIDKNKDSCRADSTSNTIVWSESCNPDVNFVETKFMEYFNDNFNSSIRKYPVKDFQTSYTNVLNGDKIDSNSQPIKLEAKRQSSFAIFNLSYNFNSSIHTNLSEQKTLPDNFVDVYNNAINAKNKCNNDINCIKNKMNLGDWNLELEKSPSYIIFKLKTKTSYFYNDGADKFAPIELNFALAL